MTWYELCAVLWQGTGFSVYCLDKTAQTIRKNYCLTGEAFGIRPIKIGNRLMWRVNDVARLIEEGETKMKKTPTSIETKMSALSKPNSNTEQVWGQAND